MTIGSADGSTQGSFIATGRVDMYTEIRGEGRDLLLLHGGSGSIADLDGLRERLVGTHRVIAPDQRGHGRTPDPGVMSYAAMAADTAALLDVLGLDGVDVVGWSDGGIVGLMLAVDRPDLVRRLVPIGANVAEVGAPTAFRQASADWFDTATPADLLGPEADAGRAERLATAARILDMWRRGPELTLAGLAALAAPVRFVSGDRDIITLEHTVAMYRTVPGAELAVVPGADHSLVQTHVDAVARLVLAFIDTEAPVSGAGAAVGG